MQTNSITNRPQLSVITETPMSQNLRIPVPSPTPVAASGLARCCPRVTYLRSSALIVMTLIAVAGLAGTLVTPTLPNQELYAGAFAVLALGCLFFAKDALDQEKRISTIVTDRLLAQTQLQQTQINLTRAEQEIDEERRKLEKIAAHFHISVDSLDKIANALKTETLKLSDSNKELKETVIHMKQILEKKS